VSVFVDTGVLFAASYRRDRSHARAVELLGEVASERPFCTDHVLVEVWSLLCSGAGWEPAMRFWRAIRETPLSIEPATLAELERAEAIAADFADLELDIVDCTSFAVIERLGCRRAASFDRDFAVFRYGARRDRALDVLR